MASLLLGLVAAAHLARAGTLPWRLASAALLVALALSWTARAVWEWRSYRDPRRAARAAFGHVDRALAQKAARAAGLASLDPKTSDPLTTGLAALHLEQTLAALGSDRVRDAAATRASRWQRAALGIVALALASLAASPLRFVEGADVLLARAGRAPIAIAWIDGVVGEVQVPRYLRQRDQLFIGLQPTAHPAGSVITLRGQPLHPGRHLIVTDGATEVPFTDDGRGGLAARWTLAGSVRLEVAARFGDVLVVQGEPLDIESIADEAPRIEVDGAPKTLQLTGTNEIDVRYRAMDDHGLTQIDVVLRAGDKEERRVLARHHGQEQDEKGSIVIPASDPVLRRAYVPVEITIEARDNDPITGPKWGRSPAITVVPPAIGEAEALRFEALRRLRDRAVDQLAERVGHDNGDDADRRAAHAASEVRLQQELAAHVDEACDGEYGGRRMPGRLCAFLTGQVERLGKAVRQEAKDARTTAVAGKLHDATREKTGDAVLAFDSAMRSFGALDAMSIAKRLSDVAGAAAQGAQLARNGEPERGMSKMRASLTALRAGAGSLARLEVLGKDLGEVVDIGTRRIERALSARDIHHAELAAEHLADRLRHPFPSFSGGGGLHGTGGEMMPGPSSGEESSTAEQQFDAQQSEIEQIAREHAAQMDELRDVLEKSQKSADDQALRDALREHAERVRKSVGGLPTDASGSSPVESAAAVVRSNAEMMADSMERMALPGAVSGGRNALNAADNARRLAQEERSLFGEPSPLAPRVAQARETVEQELRWLDQQMQRVQREAADKAGDVLDEAADKEEQFGRRTDEMSKRSQSGEAPLPESSSDMLERASRAMRDAASAYRARDTQRGAERQRDAQRLLETAQAAQEHGSERDAARSSEAGQSPVGGEQESPNGPQGTERVDIPGADQFKGPEGFRRRVIDGLGSSSDPRLRDAVRRYAEGLLR